eukprot:COSAG06_NODE_669_length_13222_cov_8.235922_13_plen_156_part_00
MFVCAATPRMGAPPRTARRVLNQSPSCRSVREKRFPRFSFLFSTSSGNNQLEGDFAKTGSGQTSQETPIVKIFGVYVLLFCVCVCVCVCLCVCVCVCVCFVCVCVCVTQAAAIPFMKEEEVRKRLCCAPFYSKRKPRFYQDRLGTNTGKTQKKES